MVNSKKASLQKGRWLVLEQTKNTQEEILSLIRAIDGAEIQIMEAKTYVRFPVHQAKAVNPFFNAIKILRQKRSELFVESSETGSLRQYCAVMIKNQK